MVSATVKPAEVAAKKESVEAKDKRESGIKPGLKRYIILFLFCFNTGNKAFQWIQIPACTAKIAYFYSIENFIINATSVLFMLAFVVLSLPACLIIKRLGLRNAVLLSSFGATLGSVIKCFSCEEEGIYMLFLGQVVVSLSEQFIFSVPSRLASVWFPDHQVSSAIAMSLVGNQVGVALGFFVPQLMLGGRDSKEEIGDSLYLLFYYNAWISAAVFVAGVLLFDEAPKHAPGYARLKQIKEEEAVAAASTDSSWSSDIKLLWQGTKQLLSNPDYRKLCVAYGINTGLIYTIATVLNQMLELGWPGDDIVVGNTGFLIIMGGVISAPIWGHVMDKYHCYLLLNNSLTVASIASLSVLGFIIWYKSSVAILYLVALVCGSFQTGIVVGGLELGVELTYPSPELITSTILNVPPQIFGTILVFAASYINDWHGIVAVTAFYFACLLVPLILMLNITEILKRKNAASEKQRELTARAEKELSLVVY